MLKNKDCDRKAVREAFAKKCELKKVPFKAAGDFFGKDVPAFDIVVAELRARLETLII